ncbi:hypothetical protein [Paenibacillus piscarius]|uniref:hypothetical protein n=1 Tax=Paenibacillus piscarius TaxID=1089681 RepID=UPI001EE800DD|nr:hypothetical protein [Paenibacillus piscarius]
MSELLELRLEVLPGVIKATGSVISAAADEAGRPGVEQGEHSEQKRRVRQSVPEGQRELRQNVPEGQHELRGTEGKEQQQVRREVVTLRLVEWPPARKRDVLRLFSGQPGGLYDLLQGSVGGVLGGLELVPADAELEQAILEQGRGLLPAAELLHGIRQQLVKEPLLALALRGLSKEELLSGVFALWADQELEQPGEEGPPAPVSLAAELARLERKGPAVSSGEWLAEAAAEGSLHQPGPLFHELAPRPFPALPEVMEPEEDWSALLPQTPKAREGLALLMRRAAESAARRAADLNKP